MNAAGSIQIVLASGISEMDRVLAVRYLLSPRTITPEERNRALNIFDKLGSSTITIGGRTDTFAAFHKRHIDDVYANNFLDQLLNAVALETMGTQIMRDTWQRIMRGSQNIGLQLAGDIGQQCLIAFCAYWWQSFGKGYIREIAVFRDLEQSGIQFDAHDLKRRVERFSPQDLFVLGFRGDVKTSTYFLHVARSFPLANDFYLVRIYDVPRQTWLDIAMIKPAMWQVIDGDTVLCEVDQITQLLPTPLRVMTRNEALIVIALEDWKQRVLRVQAKRGEKSP